MTTDADNVDFQARVHQGHVDNFKRKISTAERRSALDHILSTVNTAASNGMIEESDREALQGAISDRRRTIPN